MNTKIIAEIGINHNGSLDIIKKMIDISKVAGCDYVKFQKRNPDVCVPDSEKIKIKSTPWGEMTYLNYKKKIELDKNQYDQINEYCVAKGIGWFASVWDIDSVDFMSNYKTILNGEEKIVMKIPSALITNDELIEYARNKSDYLMISTGMSIEDEIVRACEICKPDLIFHTNSTYPSPNSELNLDYINWLKNRHPNAEIGYSGHEYGLTTTFAAVAMGAKWIERHVTLDRNMWGSDQLSSIEPIGLLKLVKGIRDIDGAMGPGGPRDIYGSELKKKDSLRG